MDPEDLEARVGRGVELWNARRWFECHDELEGAWKAVKHEKKREPAQDPRRDFLHGLILLAVAYHHWSKGNRVGVQRKRKEAVALLASYPAEVYGVRLHAFVEAVAADLEWGQRGAPYSTARPPPLESRLARLIVGPQPDKAG